MAQPCTGLWASTTSKPLPHRAQRVHSHNEASTSSSSTYEFTYSGSDGRKKATFEQAFKSGAVPTDESLAPWELGYQMSEKNLAWNDDLKARLLTQVVANKLHLSDEELAARLENLKALLPDIQGKLASMRPSVIMQLLANIETLPERLMALKITFPDANISKLVVREPQLVLGFDVDHLSWVAGELRALLPSLNVDKLVEENPSMLDIEELKVAMAEAARIMPGINIEKSMGADPQIILSFQRGAQLIPYDPPVPEKEDDDEYSQYYS